jgi:hypothetical protein
MAEKYYNIDEGVKGRDGGPYLPGTHFVTGEELVKQYNHRFGTSYTVEDITAPVAFEVGGEPEEVEPEPPLDDAGITLV